MLKNVKFFTHYLLRPTLAVLPYAAMGLNVLCEGSGLLNFNCITFFILIIPHRTLHNRRCRPEA